MSHFSGPDVADLAAMSVQAPLTGLVTVMLDLRAEGSYEPTYDLIRVRILR